MHCIRSDQLYRHYLGDPLEVLMLYPDGSGAIVTVGPDLRAGMRPQLLVPTNTFHASHLLPGRSVTPCSPARSGPASSPPDVEQGDIDALAEAYPGLREGIRAFAG